MSQVSITSRPLKRKFSFDAGGVRKKAKPVAVMAVNRIPRTMRSFPKTQRVKLRYSQIQDFTVAAGTPAAINIRANGPFDPDALTGGIQPRGWAQWSAFYERYTCVGAKIHMRLLDKDTGTSVTGTVTGLYGITVRDSTSFVSDVKGFIEDDDTKYSGYDSWHAAAKVTHSINVAKYFTVKDILDDSQLGGLTGSTLVGSVPSKQVFFACWATQAPSTGASAQVFVADIFVEYDVIFTDLKDLPSST